MRRLWPAAVALALAALLAAWVDPDSPASRIGNLDLEAPAFDDTYIIKHRTEADRCFVVDRRDATRRRSDDNQPGRKWDCYRLESPRADAPPTWIVQSKREGKGTVLLVPAQEVLDWSYPFLYGFVRAREEEHPLPRVEWTQLYVSRLYQGLYLRVHLPFDLRKKDGGSGVLRELLYVEGDRVSTVDTRLDDAPGLYAESVAEAREPVLSPPSAALAWLASRAPTPGTTLVVSNEAPHGARLLPLPVSLPDLFVARFGRAPASFRDARLARFDRSAWGRSRGGDAPWTGAEAAAFEREFAAYATSLRAALSLDAVVREEPPPREEWLKRQAAVSDLQLESGEL